VRVDRHGRDADLELLALVEQLLVGLLGVAVADDDHVLVPRVGVLEPFCVALPLMAKSSDSSKLGMSPICICLIAVLTREPSPFSLIG
jgi:hypothetical protein